MTIAHSRTADLAAEVARADIVVAAIGKAEMVRGGWIREGAVVIDVGMNRLADGRLVGDVEYAGRAARVRDHAGPGRRGHDARDAAREHDRPRQGVVEMKRAALAAALLLASAGGCRACGAPTFTVRAPRAQAPPAAPPLAGPALRVLHLADFGDDTRQQAVVAGAVVEAHRRAPFDLAVFPGDNVYECGPTVDAPGADACRFGADENTVAPGFTPPRDGAFARHEAPLAPLAGVPVYLALGNHDVAAAGVCALARAPAGIARQRACLEVAHASPVWRMPGRHYAVERGAARFLVVDSNLLKGDYGGFTLDGEIAFVAAQRPAAARTRARRRRAAARSRGASSSRTTRPSPRAGTGRTRRPTTSRGRRGSSRQAAGACAPGSRATTTICSTSARRTGSTCSSPGTGPAAAPRSGSSGPPSRARSSCSRAFAGGTPSWTSPPAAGATGSRASTAPRSIAASAAGPGRCEPAACR